MQSTGLFEEAYLLPNTEIFQQESQLQMSSISFHIDTTSCKYQSKSTRKIFNSVKNFFLSIAETVLPF